jgi:predicted nucleic acid-binding protein
MAEAQKVVSYALDAFALMALLEGEEGAATVRDLLREAAAGRVRLYMCVVNLGEVIYTLRSKYGDGPASGALDSVTAMPLKLVEADLELTRRAADIKTQAKRRRKPLAYADCFAAALAQHLDGTLVTGDPEFKQVEDAVRIEWL